MDILDYSQISPSRLKILTGIRWTNFLKQQSRGERKQNKQNTVLFAVPNWCKSYNK